MTGGVMTARQFSDRHSAKTLLARWMLQRDIDDFLGMTVTGGVILADALSGDGMRDHISPDLLDAFHALMGEKAGTADNIRDILVQKIMQGDAAVFGLINKIKGQVGENIFVETATAAGFSAHLADAKNQEAWDCCVTGADGIAQYVQVKTYGSADDVVAHMKTVAEKVAQGKVTDGTIIVEKVDFAVPEDIHAAVVEKAGAAGLDAHVWAFDLSADDAARIVRDGFDHVSASGLGNFFGELAGATLAAGVMHALVRGFLLRKEASEGTLRHIATETGISAGGIGASLGMEGVIVKGLGLATKGIPATALLVVTGLTARGILRRIVARRDYLGFMKQENTALRRRQQLIR